MRTRRGDSLRGKMVNYSHMLVVALSVTSLVLLVKYHGLTNEMTQEIEAHRITKNSLQDDLVKESDRYQKLNKEVEIRENEIKILLGRVKSVETELTNSVTALQASDDRIQSLKLEIESQSKELDKQNEDNSNLQVQVKSLQDLLATSQDELLKTQALVDDASLTIKDAHGQQEKIMSENTRLTRELADYQAVKAENEELKTKFQAALTESNTAAARVKELEEKVAILEEQKSVPEENKESIKEEEPNAEEKEKQMVEEAKQEAPNETINGDEQSPKKQDKEDDMLQAYDMLNEETKKKLKSELQNNDDEDFPDGGEELDETNADGKELNPARGVLEAGDGRELEEPARFDDADKNLEDKLQTVPEGGAPEDGAGVVAAPKAFEEIIEIDSSFAALGHPASSSLLA